MLFLQEGKIRHLPVLEHYSQKILGRGKSTSGVGNSYVPYPLNRSNEGPTDLIVVLNVESVGCVSESRGLVEISQVAPQVGVVYDTLLVTLKNLIIG